MNVQLPNSYAARVRDSVLYPYDDPKKGTDFLIITKGEGPRVIDEAGKSYLEGVSALWCTSLGFSNERLVKAAYDQLRTLPFYQSSTFKAHPRAIEIGAKLMSVAPDNIAKVFFANSGSEANDSAVKMIWYYNNARGKPQKKKIISRINAYHGCSVASGSLTGLPISHRSFDLPIDRVFHVMEPHYFKNSLPGESEEEFSTRCATELEDLIQREGPDTVAAMFMEPVTGAGGVVIPPRTYIEKMQAVLQKYDVLLVADEVVCGFGRIGTYWGHQAVGMKPDILTCAKALSSGYMPISAILIGKKVMAAIEDEANAIGGFAHSLTYFAHPVAAAVAIETLNIYDEMDVVDHIGRLGALLQNGLRERFASHPIVGEVRGMGLLAALEFAADRESRTYFQPERKIAYRVEEICEENGLILRPMSPHIIAICPPYVMSEADIGELLDKLEIAVNQTAREMEEGRL